MKHEEVDKALVQKFNTEAQRLVFWHDTEAEFAGYVQAELPEEIANVKVLNVTEVGGFKTKLMIELEEPETQFLVYSTGEQPPMHEDFLFDIRLYSDVFEADVLSLWFKELGLSSLQLKSHLKKRKVFCQSQRRRSQLNQLLESNLSGHEDPTSLDVKMIAALVRCERDDLFTIIYTICKHHCQNGMFELSSEPAVFETLEKMNLEETFWTTVSEKFDYSAERSFIALMRRIFASDFLSELSETTLSALEHFQLPEKGSHETQILFSHWREVHSAARSYAAASLAFAAEFSLSTLIRDVPIENLRTVDTFWEIEEVIVNALAHWVQTRKEPSATKIEEWYSVRKDGHWFTGVGRDTPERVEVLDTYRAVLAAAKLLEYLDSAPSFSVPATAADFLQEYVREHYKLDRWHRDYFSFLSASNGRLRALSTTVEQAYLNSFLKPFGRAWGNFLNRGFLAQWSVPGMINQQDFYQSVVLPARAEAKPFVIISDAFRYEAAVELVESLRGSKIRATAELSSMLGVLPSYTKLAMASLLPHQRLTYENTSQSAGFKNHLPYPLAKSWQAAMRAEEGTERLEVLIDGTLAIFLRMISGWLLSDYLRGPASENVERELINLSRPSNGHYRAIIRETLKHSATQSALDSFFQSVYDWHFNAKGKPTNPAKLLDQLVTDRNKKRHGYADNRQEAIELCKSFQEKLVCLLSSATWLQEYRIFHVQKIKRLKSGACSGRLSFFVGENEPVPFDAKWSADLYEDDVYLVNKQGSKILEISPFFQIEYCKTSRIEKLYLWIQTKKDQFVLGHDASKATIHKEPLLSDETSTTVTDWLEKRSNLSPISNNEMDEFFRYRPALDNRVDRVLVDGMASASTADRNLILSKVNGFASKVGGKPEQDLAVLKRNGRELLKDKEFVYVYHNKIDARGDNYSTENETYDAVESCIQDLLKLVNICINSLNASRIWITADHGFLFQNTLPTESQRTKSGDNGGSFKFNKRFILGQAPASSASVHRFNTADTAGTTPGVDGYVPRVINRFDLRGGAKFVHGGAMPQEIIVPLVSISALRGEKAKDARAEKVRLECVEPAHILYENEAKFKFIQTQKISERVSPVTVQVAIYDGTQPVSSIETQTFDSTTDSFTEREKVITLRLQKGAFDYSKIYRLVVRDNETDVELYSHELRIEVSFPDLGL